VAVHDVSGFGPPGQLEGRPPRRRMPSPADHRAPARRAVVRLAVRTAVTCRSVCGARYPVHDDCPAHMIQGVANAVQGVASVAQRTPGHPHPVGAVGVTHGVPPVSVTHRSTVPDAPHRAAEPMDAMRRRDLHAMQGRESSSPAHCRRVPHSGGQLRALERGCRL
jgi:hypothetical protein